MKQPVIYTQNLSKQFGSEEAVKDVTFSIPEGTIFGFIGPSGSGKTTTLRLLTGLYRPTEGKIAVLNEAPSEFSRATQRKIGYMPQLFVLYDDLSVWENLNFVASLYGVGFGRAKRLNELLDFVELSSHKDKVVRKLSGGMKRRLSLAATLIHRPKLIFLDEPTAGIDPVLRRKFWDHFQTIREQGQTLFITTQYVGEAAYCDYVGVLANGRLLMVDTPKNLRRRAYGGDIIKLRTADYVSPQVVAALRLLPFIQGDVTRTGPQTLRIVTDNASTVIPLLIDWAKEQHLTVESIEEDLPPFDDVFVELVKNGDTHG
ncbi:MAG: ABC transporter ATP-binding protein [Anaerolineaceae bacterium]|nr:ABC transporter ATP-binding protein [Anaerolineaceae bacterium]MCB9098646.1 ABC transporter ATP-binding protein [Anaerolineales bacterium]